MASDGVAFERDDNGSAALRVQLEAAHRRLLELEEVSQVGIWEWDVISDVMRCSEQMYRIFDVKPDQCPVTFDAYLSQLRPEDRSIARAHVERAASQPDPFAADVRLIERDGRARWLHWRGRAVFNDAGVAVRIVGTAQDITEQKLTVERLLHATLHDPLTGLANRFLLMDRLEHALLREARTQHRTAVFFIDLDGFKQVNDGAGHVAGDRALRELSELLCRSVRQHDTVARFGGDEFVVVAEDLEWPHEVIELGRRLLTATSMEIRFEHGEAVVTASVGGASAQPGAGPEDVLRDADAAMYSAKRSGGNALVVAGFHNT